jgi:gliding motility-associated-like protein
LGSSLLATSTHALQKTTWYHNGQAVSTATGSQSLSTAITRLQIFPQQGIFQTAEDYQHIGTDDAGNIYVLYAYRWLYKRTPAGTTSQIVDFLDSTYQEAFGISVDPAGNVYVSIASANFVNGTTSVVKVPAGSVSSALSDLPVVVPNSAVPLELLPISADFVDCQNNFYLFCGYTGNVFRYTPGANAATSLVSGASYNTGCGLYGGIGAIYTDVAGNVFFQDGGGVEKIPPGAPHPVNVVPNLCQTPINSRILGSFWIDGGDTIYLNVEDGQNQMFYMEKWAPGATSGQQIISQPIGKQNWAGDMPLTMDVRGDLLTSNAGDSVLYEFKRTTTIDSAFTPTDTGSYYAVVTDIRGYTTTSDTFHVNTPGPAPSIQIAASATSTPVCTPITFIAAPANPGFDPAYQWIVSGVRVGNGSLTYANNLFADSDQVYCIMNAQAGCQGPVMDTSNIILLDIDPHGTASVKISASKGSLCTGDTALFTAIVSNGSNNPALEWLLNGDSTGNTGDTYTNSSFSTGDVVTCLITSDDVCGLAKSNSISLTINAPPAVESGQVITILHGHSEILQPVVMGDANAFLWTPGTGLSDPTIEDPIASPDTNTLYTLKVTAPAGCTASGTILVNVYTPLSIPNAFTPNGDGHNDLFYVLGAPINSGVEEFAVFDRYGAEVYHVHGVSPGDANVGWNGYFRGTPAPSGTYIYQVVMEYAGGHRQVYKGTVILIR